jgi:hypothetical protein
MPRSPGHVCHDRLQAVLIEAAFDAFAEATCKPWHAATMGAPSISTPLPWWRPRSTRRTRALRRRCRVRWRRRQTWLRGRENVHKHSLIHVAGHNLGLPMRHRTSAATPKDAAARGQVLLLLRYSEEILAIVLLAVATPGGKNACGFLGLAITAEPA